MIDPNDQTALEIVATAAAIITPLFVAQMIAASLEARRDRRAQAHARARAARLRRRAQIERNRARNTTTRKETKK